MAQQQERAFNIPLNGRLRTVDDGVLLGEGDFKELTNMRYGEYNPKTIRGMTKINAAATSYLSVQNGIHFKKDDISENHVIAQTTTGSNSRLVKSDNTTSIPSQDTFSTWLALTSNNRIYPSKAPDSSVALLNGVKNYIWGGSEARCPKFITSSAAITNSITNPVDYTEKVNNSLTDSENVAIIGGGNDSYTKLLLHGDGADASTTITDSSSTGRACTAVNNCQIDTAQAKFGTGSILFDGTNDYITALDSDDWYFGTGDFTIDFWVRFNDLTSAQPVAEQYVDNDNYWTIWKTSHADGDKWNVYFKSGAAVKANYQMASSWSGAVANTWYHIEICRSTTTAKIFINGVSQTLTETVAFGANDVGNLASVLYIGITGWNAAYDLNGWIDEYRISKGIARHTSDFTVATKAYNTQALYWLIGAIRPIQGAKFYIGDANATANTLSVKEWNGYSWNTLTVATDGTRNVGDSASLTQTGSVTFTSTESTSKARLLNETYAYWYQFAVTAGEATIYRVTLDMAPQEIVDIWDGVFRNCLSFFKFTTAYADYTINTLETDYVSSDALSYAQVGGLAAFSTPNNCLFVGFTERMTGLRIILPDESYQNATAATTMAVDYWDGYTWQSVGDLADGTSTSAISMSQTGTVTWNPIVENTEFKTTIGNGTEYFYYRLRWDKELDDGAAGNNVRIDTVYGIPVPKDVKPFRFPAFWQNRLWLFGNQYGAKNTGLCSSYGTVCVFNGSDSIELEFDGGTEVVAAVPLFTRYGGTTYENLLCCKRNSTYLVDGTGPSDYKVIEISTSEGCVAPMTMRACDLGYEVAPGITKHVAIWVSASGVVMFDGSVVSDISGDIKDRFQSWKANYINTSQVANFFGEYDMTAREYHLMIATGSSETLNEEWVYDLLKKKWYLIDRGATKRLVSAFPVTDSYGNFYLYGGTSDGYIERLEYGTTFDGTSITSTMNLGDVPLSKTPLIETEMKKVRLVGVAKTTTSNTVALTHYADTATSGTSLTAITPTATGKRVYIKEVPVNQRGIFHGLKFVMITSDETTGFEPLVVSGVFRPTREEHLSA